MNTLPKLDERLKTVYDLYPVCESGADIGADHGRLSCHLLASKKVRRMQVTDISESSLSKAKQLLQLHELSQNAVFSVGDGLFALKQQADAISICGMGGEVICGILEKGRDLLEKAELILCPQTDFFLVRHKIGEIGYHITDERIALASGRLYCIIKAAYGTAPLSERECFLGPCLMQKKNDPLVRQYFHWRLDTERCIKVTDNTLHLIWLQEMTESCSQ